jgi:Cys-tRNA synthase (O-phospho-L-seryl-tRNA:Cys-tRNA synthase)
VIVRKTYGGRVVRDPIQPNGHRVLSEQTKDASTFWESSYALCCFWADAHVNEVGHPTVRIQDAEGAILGIDKIDGRLNNPTQCRRQFQSGRDRNHGGKETLLAFPSHTTILP